MKESEADALLILARNFPASAFLGEAEAAAIGEELARLGISGGRGLRRTRRRRRQTATGDRSFLETVRARTVYDALNIEIEFIS